MNLTERIFGYTSDGDTVKSYIMTNSRGMSVCILEYGCIIQKLEVPDRVGLLTDVVLGFDTMDEYEFGGRCFGALVGRYANRIKDAQFTIDGRTYILPQNDSHNHLNGTYTKRIFHAEQVENKLVFHGISPDGEEGYPGRVTFDVSYEVTENNELIVEYTATTDKDTIINLTNHSYFNLNGQDGRTIEDLILTLNSDFYAEGDAEYMPTGAILSVAGTPMDFRNGKAIGAEIGKDWNYIKAYGGYDHTFALRKERNLSHALTLESPRTGIRMKCFTTQPCVQLYTGNYINDAVGKRGVVYPKHGGVCLETMHFPCSPSYSHFPSTVLRKGETYKEMTIYRFE